MLVIVYMILSYGFFGVLANIALAANITLILGTLSFIQATLTLPGIAGIVLTMGMAVDANVLVFERIREELRRGRNVMAAIDGGYQRVDFDHHRLNPTTLFAALFLGRFGSGPIRIRHLAIGIVTSLFTAVMVTRMPIIICPERKRPRELFFVWHETRTKRNEDRFPAAAPVRARLFRPAGGRVIAMFTIIGLNLGIVPGGILIEARNTEGPADIGGLRSISTASASAISACRALVQRRTSLSASSARMVTKRHRSPPSS